MLQAVDPRPLLRARLLALPRSERDEVLRAMSVDDRRRLHYDWRFWRRPNQATPDGLWRYWFLLAGRGYGKSRVGAETVRDEVKQGRARMIALVGRTLADVRDTMILGPAGILKRTPEEDRPTWIPARRTLEWPNGAVAHVFTSEEPDQLRGPERDFVWGDEVAAWMHLEEMWMNVDMVMRATGPKGHPARGVFTTTPRPLPLLKRIIKDPLCVVTRGSTFENAENLDPIGLAKLEAAYAGTRIGRQELFAEIIDDVEGALWTGERIERSRVPDYPALRQLWVAVDPAVSHGASSAETGIIVVGAGDDGHFYVLDDATIKGTPGEWGNAAVAMFTKWEADGILAEVNNGGDLVVSNIHAVDPRVPVSMVRASRGKRARAEPVAALYERLKPIVHHVGMFPLLEKQMTEWTGDEGQASPDRVDALVWGITKLAFEGIDNLQVGFA